MTCTPPLVPHSALHTYEEPAASIYCKTTDNLNCLNCLKVHEERKEFYRSLAVQINRWRRADLLVPTLTAELSLPLASVFHLLLLSTSNMSWFWRGFQSAVFYYVSCAPCTQMAYRRRRRKGAARSKNGEEMDQSLYPHPSPFTTNIYWREEMALGPGPPQKKRDREKERQQRSKGSHRDLMTGNSNDTGTSSADTMVATSPLQGVAEMEQERRSEEGWNRRRYQREDESLWGLDDGSEDGHPFTETYCTARNPEVNDLHPPVVSTQPTHRSETKWMLQPPPSAKVMEGKERALRSRSGSGGSNGSSRRGVIGLGRQIGERMVEKKRKEGQAPEASSGSAAMSRATSRESNDPTRGQRHDRDAPPR
ncbi:MAG: hypothetical protein Q9173_007236, partial [Seirophora scorigena]